MQQNVKNEANIISHACRFKKNMSLFVIFHALKQMALRKMLDYQKQYLDEWGRKITNLKLLILSMSQKYSKGLDYFLAIVHALTH